MLKFLGGEGSSFRLDQDSAGRFISQLTVSHPDDYDDDHNHDDYDDIEDDHDFDDDHDQVERIEGDSGDTYGCQPSPGPAAEVKVHVIREGGSLMRMMGMRMHCDDDEL